MVHFKINRSINQPVNKRTESLGETSARLRHHAPTAIDQWEAGSKTVWWAWPGSVVFPPCLPSSRAHTGETQRGVDRHIWAQFPGLNDALFNRFYPLYYTQYVKCTSFLTAR